MKREKLSLTQYSKAIQLVLGNVPVIGKDEASLAESVGMVLRRDVKADRPLPPFNRSAMDGYAVKSSNIAAGKANLKVVGVVEAGAGYSGRLKNGEAIKIMTGAPLPAGADAVVKVENSRKLSDNFVELKENSAKKWLNVHKKGSDIKKGVVLVKAGELLTAPKSATIASAGITMPEVSRKIKAVFFTSGNEVIAPEKKPLPYQIRDANASSLLSFISNVPQVSASFGGLLRDNKKLFVSRLGKAIKENDLLIVTGGVSMGDSDYTYKAFEELGVREIFHKAAIRPGKPVWFGIKGRCVVFGLPGNPVSVMVTFHQFVLPAVMKMSGAKSAYPKKLFLPLLVDVQKKHSLREFRISMLADNGKTVTPIPGYNGSGDFVSASRSDGVLVLPEKDKILKAGTVVEFHPWVL